MTLQDEIKDLENQICKIDTESSALQQRSWELHNQRDKLVAKLILEENLLRGSSWIIGINFPIYLHYSKKSSTDFDMHKVKDLTREDYHSSLELQDGIELHFDDNDISLGFKEGKMILPFCQKYGLVIDGTGIVQQLSKLRREVAALEAISHQFKI